MILLQVIVEPLIVEHHIGIITAGPEAFGVVEKTSEIAIILEPIGAERVSPGPLRALPREQVMAGILLSN